MTDEALARFIDRFTIEYVRTYPHPIERVWRAISDPAQMSIWIAPITFDPRLGGAYRALWEEPSMFKGEITAFEPPRLLRFSGPLLHGPSAYLEFRLEPTPAGTRLTFVQHSEPGFWRQPQWPIDPPELQEGPGLPWRPGTLSGWHSSFDWLGDVMDGKLREEERRAEERELQHVYREHLRSIPTE